MIGERASTATVMTGLRAVAPRALAAEVPFTITLATRAAILALAAVGLHIALGIGGLVSLGHAAPFGLALNAARQAPARVEAVGLPPARLRLAAFVIPGAITGLAGARSGPAR